jgi:hypothetical protein
MLVGADVLTVVLYCGPYLPILLEKVSTTELGTTKWYRVFGHQI